MRGVNRRLLRACLSRFDVLEGREPMEGDTYDDALAIYFEHFGEGANQPAGDGSSGYDDELSGWLFMNVNGPLALVRDDGTVIEAVYDHDECEWVMPR
jgi:hypothetical protein